jgi:hypothetical protein
MENKNKYVVKRQVTILQHIVLSSFNKINREHYVSRPKPLGCDIRAEKSMYDWQDGLRVLMPQVLGVSPNSSKWFDLIKDYFSSIFVDIPSDGKVLNTTLVYHLNPTNETQQAEVKKLTQELKGKDFTIKDAKSIAEYYEGLKEKARLGGEANEDEVLRLEKDSFKYATPENIEDYLLWIYCLRHGKVANTKQLISKSPSKIEFFLESMEDRLLAKKTMANTNRKVRRLLAKVDEDKELRGALVHILGIKSTTEEDIILDIEAYSDKNPEAFINAVEDKTLIQKAYIQELINYGVLIKSPHSSLISDAEDREIVIGTSYDDAISYINAVANKAKASEFKNRLNAMKKK